MQSSSERAPSVLLAEDDPALRKLLTELLRNQGFEVLAAPNGRSALSVARNHEGPVDLLVTDVMMPKLDGFDLRERLRQERTGVRILVMSGQFEKEMVGEDFAILRKPFKPEEFVKKVKEVLAKPA